MIRDLLRWITRRHDKENPFSYTRGQGAMAAGIAFVCAVETAGMSVLLRDWPLVHAVVLVLDLSTLLFFLGWYASQVVRPHVLDADVLRVRYGARVELPIPLDRISAVRRETRYSHPVVPGELNLPVGGQTSLRLELDDAVVHRGREVRVVRLHADGADTVAEAVRRALMRERSGPSRSPGPLS